MSGTTRRTEVYGNHALQSARLARRAGVSLAALGMLAVLAACQEPQTVEVPAGVRAVVPAEVPAAEAGCQLPDINEGRKYVVEAWATPDANFDIGEPLRLQLRVSTATYVNIFYVSSSCKVTRLLYNHAVRAAEIVNFPLSESGLQMTVKPPAGGEAFYFVATRDPLNFLSPSDILSVTLGIADLDLSPAQFHQRLDDARGRIDPDDWGMHTLLTRIVDH